MDLVERIERRFDHRAEDQLVVDWDPLNPGVHLHEPVGREYILEAILDAIDPLFEGEQPPDVYIYGPSGSGKSAIVTALVSALQSKLSSGRNALYTTTRARNSTPDFGVAYIDARRTPSEFQLYRGVLDALVPDPIPDRGIGTTELVERLHAELETVDGIVVLDHFDEPNHLSLSQAVDFLDRFEGISRIDVTRTPPTEAEPIPGRTVEVPAYNYELIDILTTRAAKGLSKGIDHAMAKDLSEWASGNVHDALAALFGAAVEAQAAGRTELTQTTIERGKARVPDASVHIGRVLALPQHKQVVLHILLQIDDDESYSIDEVAERVAERTDLSKGTARRYLYELAQAGLLERTEVAVGGGAAGRRPSTISSKFPTLVYEQLYTDE